MSAAAGLRVISERLKAASVRLWVQYMASRHVKHEQIILFSKTEEDLLRHFTIRELLFKASE